MCQEITPVGSGAVQIEPSSIAGLFADATPDAAVCPTKIIQCSAAVRLYLECPVNFFNAAPLCLINPRRLKAKLEKILASDLDYWSKVNGGALPSPKVNYAQAEGGHKLVMKLGPFMQVEYVSPKSEPHRFPCSHLDFVIQPPYARTTGKLELREDDKTSSWAQTLEESRRFLNRITPRLLRSIGVRFKGRTISRARQVYLQPTSVTVASDLLCSSQEEAQKILLRILELFQRIAPGVPKKENDGKIVLQANKMCTLIAYESNIETAAGGKSFSVRLETRFMASFNTRAGRALLKGDYDALQREIGWLYLRQKVLLDEILCEALSPQQTAALNSFLGAPSDIRLLAEGGKLLARRCKQRRFRILHDLGLILPECDYMPSSHLHRLAAEHFRELLAQLERPD